MNRLSRNVKYNYKLNYCVEAGPCESSLESFWDGKDLFPYLKVPLDVRCLGMKWNHWNIICAELPTIYDSERFLLLLCTNFISTSCVFWVKSKHHIQHISVAFGLFSILFSPTDQKQKPSRAGSAMETSRCTTGLLCFHSSTRPRSVSGPSIGKIFRLVFVNNTSSIVLSLKIYFCR